jgi:hypothetical protein
MEPPVVWRLFLEMLRRLIEQRNSAARIEAHFIGDGNVIRKANLMSGHIVKTGFASQAKLRQQKNGRQKNGAETAAGLHFFCPPFFCCPVRSPGFDKGVLTSERRT